MRTTTIFAETHTSERANHIAYRLVPVIIRFANTNNNFSLYSFLVLIS